MIELDIKCIFSSDWPKHSTLPLSNTQNPAKSLRSYYLEDWSALRSDLERLGLLFHDLAFDLRVGSVAPPVIRGISVSLRSDRFALSAP